MINFDTKNLVIVAYPPGAGGKFLINCLGLSGDAVLQDATLAGLDLDGKLTTDDKFNILKNKISYSQQTKEWNDLNLGCEQLFGKFNPGHPVIFRPIMAPLSQANRLFFLVAHNLEMLEYYKNKWKNAKIIKFDTPREFVELRQNYIQRCWDNIRDPGWPVKSPRSTADFGALAHAIQEEIMNEFPSYLTMLNQPVNTYDEIAVSEALSVYHWDTNWYLSEQRTVEEIEKLYSVMSLGNFNKEYITNYYKIWMSALELS